MSRNLRDYLESKGDDQSVILWVKKCHQFYLPASILASKIAMTLFLEIWWKEKSDKTLFSEKNPNFVWGSLFSLGLLLSSLLMDSWIPCLVSRLLSTSFLYLLFFIALVLFVYQAHFSHTRKVFVQQQKFSFHI